MVERTQQKGAKTATRLVCCLHDIAFQQLQEESLGQVLSLGRLVPATTDVGIERVPVVFTECRERLVSGRVRILPGSNHETPVRRRKTMLARGIFIRFMFAGRHNSAAHDTASMRSNATRTTGTSRHPRG